MRSKAASLLILRHCSRFQVCCLPYLGRWVPLCANFDQFWSDEAEEGAREVADFPHRFLLNPANHRGSISSSLMLVRASQLYMMGTTIRTLVFITFITFTLALVISNASDMTIIKPISRAPHPWKEVVAAKLKADLAKIPGDWILEPDVIVRSKKVPSIVGQFIESLLDEESRRITAMDVSELIQCMEDGRQTAVQTVTAFCKRAAYAHQLVSPGFSSRSRGTSFLNVFAERSATRNRL